MIRIIKNTKEQVTFEKDSKDERWFNDNCTNENLLKECNRVGDKIEHVQWDDGEYIGSLLHIYFNRNHNTLKELTQMLANAQITAEANRKRVIQLKDLITSMDGEIPSDDELYKIGIFNGKGSY